MNREELDAIIIKHKKWIDNEDGGERANLRDADLRDADLRDADLRDANLRDAHLQRANLRDADLRRANLRDADLRGADLQGADLRGADLRRANLDYSAFPLWCGGTKFKADDKFVAQVLAHLCSLDVSDKARAELDKVLEFARTSHRARDCGILEEKMGANER